MALEDKDYYLIDQYLLGRLSKAEERQLKERKRDAEFQRELALQEDMMGVFQVAGREDLKAVLGGWEENIQAGNSENKEAKIRPLKRRSGLSRIWAMAAAMALMLVALWWLLTPGKTDYLAQHFEAYPNVIAPILKSDEPLTAEERAYQAYELKNYEEAERLFEKLAPSDDKAFYQAMIALEKRETSKAINLLEKVYQNSAARFRQPAMWYLALAYLEMGEQEKAGQLIKEIEKEEGHPFQEKAAKL